MTGDERLAAIRTRAEGEQYHCREHWGLFDADEDVLFLLARITDLEQQQGAAFGLTQTILGLEDAGDDPDDLVHNLTLIKTRLAARDHQTPALRALVEKWKAQALESREESRRIRRTIHEYTDAEERCLVRAELWNGCADELEDILAAPGPEPVAKQEN